MKPCFCYRLYRANAPTKISEYAFGGSLCRIQEFETLDGLRYCLTIFSLGDYKHLHFPHEEYKLLCAKLNTLHSTRSIISCASKSNDSAAAAASVSVKQTPFDNIFKIKFGGELLNVGPMTAFGLLKTAPFSDDIVDVFSSDDRKSFTCDAKWDICICKTCPVFQRLLEFETTVLTKFAHRKIEDVILFQE